MRRIGTVENEKKAFIVYTILLEEGIHATYEKQKDPQENRENVALWIYEEDQVDKAIELLESYKENPDDPRYRKIEFPSAPPQPPDPIAKRVEKENPQPSRFPLRPKAPRSYPITYFVIFLCVLLFAWNWLEQRSMRKHDGELSVQIGMTKVQQELMFDYPPANQEIDKLLGQYSLKGVEDLKELPQNELSAFELASNLPNFRGYLPYLIYWFKKSPPPENLDGPLFLKIGQGEFWRLFTPTLLHGGFLHILFNMAWVWLLLKQIEDRLPKWKILFLILVIGIVSNVAQYFVSGPYFLGFSGVVVGFVGFIWVRQKVAPWEGYPLQKSTILFLVIFVLAMFALELFSLVTAALTAKEISANIANTAHIVGGVVGAALGRLPFFSRGAK